MSVRLSSPEDYAGLLEKYDTWMFDCDGVIWSGDHSIEGAIQVLDILRSRSMSIANQFIFVFLFGIILFFVDKKVIFVTNNAAKSRKTYKAKFDGLGIEAHVVSLYVMVLFSLTLIRS